MREIGPITADAGGDRLARFGMRADLARQGQQLQRHLEVEAVRRNILGQAGAPGLLALAALDIGAKAPGPERDLLTRVGVRSEEHTSELQSLMRISYAVFCLKKKKLRLSPKHTTH